MYRIVISQQTDGKWNWTLNKNGRVLATANQGYERYAGAHRTATHLAIALGLNTVTRIGDGVRQMLKVN